MTGFRAKIRFRCALCTPRLRIVSAALIVTLALIGGRAWPQDKAPAPPKGTSQEALDQHLLDELDRELLEGLPGAKPAPERGQPGSEGAASPAPESENPLAKIASRMREAESRIAGRDTSAQTQDLQEKIVKDLAALLENAQKQRGEKKPGAGSGQGNDQAGSGGNPTAGPVRDSTDRIERGQAEAAETADVQDLMRRMWGHLPDKVRDQMQSSLSEEFLPKYQRLIEEYYKRLAEGPAARP